VPRIRLRGLDIEVEEINDQTFEELLGRKVSVPANCSYCGGNINIVEDKLIYGQTYGNQLFVCENWPKCNALAKVPPNNTTPVALADRILRQARVAAHNAFDRQWKRGKLTRSQAYEKLSRLMSISRAECHISMFDIHQCQEVIFLCASGEFQ